MTNAPPLLKTRFRGFYPVVIDIETAGFNAKTDAMLELAAVTLRFNQNGQLESNETHNYHIEPFKSAHIDPKALEFTGIDPYHPFRFAKSEKEMLDDLFKKVRQGMQEQHCQRAVLVAHNASFDMSFLQAAITRTEHKKSPFHPFTNFDTATLAALAYGQTVLARAMDKAQITFDASQAHSALYDAEKTAELFCKIVNAWPFEDKENTSKNETN
jgi:ribonuclease T